jgi:hypothetical protein
VAQEARSPAPPARGGAAGAIGAYGVPVSAPFTKSYTVGAAGTGGPCSYLGGTTGGTTTLTDVGTVTGGAGGPGTGGPYPTAGTADATNLKFDYAPFRDTQTTLTGQSSQYSSSGPFIPEVGANFGTGGNAAPPGGAVQGTPGTSGYMIIYEDIGP